MQDPKDGDRTTKNDPSNRYEEGHLEQENVLRSIWQGCQSVKITFADEDIECDVQEIRELLDGTEVTSAEEA